MKIYRIAQSTITVANVGATGSELDSMRLETVVLRYLLDNPNFELSEIDEASEYMIPPNMSIDDVDLNQGRDFLKESLSYDIVVLNYIFNPTKDFQGISTGEFQRSDVHSREEWVRRLASTGAKLIFVFGEFGEIGGWWLGNISGYSYSSRNDLSIYEKK